MAFDLFYLPFRPAIDANGIVVPGAKLYFYATGTSTPQPIYADAELTTKLDNPLGANGAGAWPSIYIDNSLTYRVVLRDADGVVLSEADPYVPGSVGGADGKTGPADNTYSSYTAMQASDPTRQSARLVGDTDVPPHADGPYSNPTQAVGGWIAQPADGIVYKPFYGTDTRTRPVADVLFDAGLVFGNYNTLATPIGFDNGPPIQKAINDYSGYASNIGRTLEIPTGLFPTGTPMQPSDYATLRGNGQRSTIFYREQNPTTAACFLQTGAQQGFQTHEGYSIRSYGFGERVMSDVDGFRRRHIAMYACDVGYQFDGLLQTSVFEDIDIFLSRIGFWGKDFVNNAVTLRDVDFKNTIDTCLLLGGAENFVAEGCRFEGGGVNPGGYTIDVKKVRSLAFDAGYMESTQEHALRMIDSEDGVCSFSNFHWTGTGAQAGGGLGYKFATDGTGRISFHNCHATYPMYVPANALMEGSNPGLIPRMFSGKTQRKKTSPNGPAVNLLSFQRFNTSNSPNNLSALRGTLRLTYIFGSADGTNAGIACNEYLVRLSVQGSGNINVEIKKSADGSTFAGSGNMVSITAGSDSTTAVLLVTLDSSVNFGGLAFANYSYEFSWDQVASLDDNALFSVGNGN